MISIFDSLRRWFPVALALALIAAVLVLGVSLARALTSGRSARAEVARLAEAQQLADQRFAVARRDAVALARQADRVLAQHADLSAEVDRLRRASPGARVVGGADLRTGTLVAGGTPRPVEPRAPEERGPGACGPAPACLLAPGDAASIDVAQVALETRAGNRVIVGRADAYREDPAGRVLLFGGPFDARISAVTEAAPPTRPGWAFGPTVELGSRSGWLYGAQTSPPPWGPVELHLRIAGKGQEGQFGASVLWRFR
jgi:hypothetical protein